MKYFLWVLLCSFTFSQIPAYYADIDFGLEGEALESQLHTLLVDTHDNPIEYTSSFSFDTWDSIKSSDLETSESLNVLLMYGYDDNDGEYQSDRLRDKNLSCHTSSCQGYWNREHVFAQSMANPNMDTEEPGISTDLHNLRACDSSKNSSRSNRLFTYGTGMSSYTVNSDEFYPGEEWKGDVARIIMYMQVHYTDEVQANMAANSSHSYHAEMPDIFLTWNVEDPVSALEIRRNDIIEATQGNRNPFIDNPFLAHLIWGGPEPENTWNLSLEDLVDLSNRVEFSPNPANDIVTIHRSIQSIQLYSASGKLVLESKDSTFSVKSLQKGIYVLKIMDLNGNTHTSQLIKN